MELCWQFQTQLQWENYSYLVVYHCLLQQMYHWLYSLTTDDKSSMSYFFCCIIHNPTLPSFFHSVSARVCTDISVPLFILHGGKSLKPTHWNNTSFTLNKVESRLEFLLSACWGGGWKKWKYILQASPELNLCFPAFIIVKISNLYILLGWGGAPHHLGLIWE